MNIEFLWSPISVICSAIFSFCFLLFKVLESVQRNLHRRGEAAC